MVSIHPLHEYGVSLLLSFVFPELQLFADIERQNLGFNITLLLFLYVM